MWIIGKIHDPPTPFVGQPRGPNALEDEAPAFFDSFQDKPVCINHDMGFEVGRVLKVWPSALFHGAVLASLYLDHHNPLLINIVSSLVRGEYNGLSITQFAIFNPETGVRHTRAFGVEISLVKEGAVENSRIVAFGIGPHTVLSQSGFNRVLMTSEKQDIEAAEQMQQKLTPEYLKALHEENEKLRERSKRLEAIEQEEMRKKGEQMAKDFEEFASQIPEDVDEATREALKREVEAGMKTGQLAPVQAMLRVSASVAREHKTLANRYQQTLLENEALKKRVIPEELSLDNKRTRVRTEEQETPVASSAYDSLRRSLEQFHSKPLAASSTPAPISLDKSGFEDLIKEMRSGI